MIWEESPYVIVGHKFAVYWHSLKTLIHSANLLRVYSVQGTALGRNSVVKQAKSLPSWTLHSNMGEKIVKQVNYIACQMVILQKKKKKTKIGQRDWTAMLHCVGLWGKTWQVSGHLQKDLKEVKAQVVRLFGASVLGWGKSKGKGSDAGALVCFGDNGKVRMAGMERSREKSGRKQSERLFSPCWPL